jgi:hypothetical protein
MSWRANRWARFLARLAIGTAREAMGRVTP